MPTEKDPTQEIQTQVLDGIRKSQEAVIDGMRAWTETIQQLVPGTGQSALPRTAQLPSASSPTACLAPPPRSASQSRRRPRRPPVRPRSRPSAEHRTPDHSQPGPLTEAMRCPLLIKRSDIVEYVVPISSGRPRGRPAA
jgi:hypothetical protein